MSETNMTNQDLENIRAVAPKGANWLCVTPLGAAFWQETRGDPDYWYSPWAWRWMYPNGGYPRFDNDSPFAIDLKTGAIHVQHAGKIVVVSLAEWSAEE